MTPIIRKAVSGDINSVSEIYDKIHAEEAAGRMTIGWLPEFYPVIATAQQAYTDGELFVMETDGNIVAAAIINNKQPEAYSLVEWGYAAAPLEAGVLHTLVVDPRFCHSGYGRAFVALFEDYCVKMGWNVARLDTQTKNDNAMSFYPKLGYKLVGVRETKFYTLPQKVMLAMFEKRL